MSVVAGTLEIQLRAELAKLSTDMLQAKRIVGDATSAINKQVDTVRSAFQALGLGISLASFGLFAKSVIDGADALGKLSQKTGIAVADLSQLKHAAALSDVSVESLAKGMKGLSQRITEANDPASKAGKIMNALGVDLRAGAAPAIDKIAEAFSQIPDGTTKAALAVEVFGKAGMDMIPLLNQGAAGIRAMKEEAERLGLTLSEEAAKAAEAFNDNLTAVKASSSGAGIAIFNDLSPAMVRVTRAMKEAAEESGMLKAIWVAMGGIASEALGLNTTNVEALTRNLRRAQEEAAKFAANLDPLRRKELLEGLAKPGNMVEASFVKANFQIRLTQSTLDAMAGKYGDQVSRAAAQGKGVASGSNSDLESRIRALLGADGAAEKATDDAKRLRELDLKGWVAYIDARTAEYEEGLRANGKALDEWRADEAKALKLSDAEWVRYIDATIEEYERGLREVGSLQPSYMEAMQKQWGGFLDGIEGAFRQGWMAFGDGAKSAATVARDALKRTLYDWLWQAMAKPFILNVVASGANAMGLSGLGSLATSAAGGSNILGGLGSLVSSFAGPELLGSAGAAGSGFLGSMGSMLSAAGPYVAAIAAAYALYKAFADKGENWKGKLGFGANANAYTTTGPFGVQGFEYLAGDDTTNRAIQAFMGSTIGIDRQLAARMTPEQIAAITGRLGGAYTTRADGQPAEFAFGKDDTTAAAQLTKEYLQRKYSIVLESIDAEFAEFIRTFGGTSEELLTAIGEFAGILDALDATGIKGFNLETLKAFKREGESLGEAFARVSKMWNEYQNLFLTDAEKLALVQDQVAGVFDGLGIAVPASMEDFKALVNSLDLSTEAGRAAWQALMAVAPAFATVANAAKSLLATFDQIVGSMRPGYSKDVLEQSLESEVKKFMGGASWTSGMDWRYVAGQLRNIERGDFQNYSVAQQQIITTILSIMSQLDGLGDAAGDAGRTITGLGGSAATAINAMADAKDNLWAYLRGLYTNSALSPLDPMQQLGVAKSDFLEMLGLAQGGDVGAAGGLQGLIDRALGIARTVYGSAPGYRDFFDWITTAAGEFARPGQSQDLQAGIYAEARTGNDIMREVRQILLDIRDKGTADGEQVAGAVQNAALATERR